MFNKCNIDYQLESLNSIIDLVLIFKRNNYELNNSDLDSNYIY